MFLTFHIKTGGLLSDVFLHLVPHSFMGEHQDSGVHFVMVEEKRNILIGFDPNSSEIPFFFLFICVFSLAVFIGFAAFFVMEKTLRVLGAEDSDGHSHSHSHHETVATTTAVSMSVSSEQNAIRTRGSGNGTVTSAPEEEKVKATSGPSKLSAYLNLFGDFVHNM
jgi:zinc transporter 7